MEFEPYSITHFLVLITGGVGWWLIVKFGKGRSQDPHFYSLRIFLAATILGVSAFWTLFKLMPGRWNPDSAWPLHLCDFAWMAACCSLIASEKKDALAHQLVFFWGLGLSTQAFVQPTLTDGPRTIDFWFFWLPHWQIVAVGLLNFFGFGFHPTKVGLWRTIKLTVLLVSLVTAINVFFDTPYCFTGRGNPDNPTVIDYLGPWPWRIPVLFAIVIVWFAFLAKVFGEKERRERP